MRVKVKLNKLEAAEAQFVSLVRRSANQIPFRIQKADEGDASMSVDLSGISRILSGSKKATTMKAAAIVVRKSDKMDEVKALIQKAGFSTEKIVENADGTVAFPQVDDYEKDSKAIRFSENLVVVAKEYAPWAANIQTFSEQVGLDGYYGGLIDGCGSLRELVSNIVYKSNDHAEMVTKVSKAVDDFAAYAKSMCAAIPASVYRLDEGLTSVQKASMEAAMAASPSAAVTAAPVMSAAKGECTSCAPGPCKCAATTTEGKGAAAVAAAPVAETTAAVTAAAVTATAGTGAAAVAAAPVESAAPGASQVLKEGEEDRFAKLMTALDALSAKFTTFETVQKSQGERIEAVATDLGNRVQEVVTKADATEKVLKSTVTAPPPAGDHPAKGVVKKNASETTGPTGEGYWDSAMVPRN